MRERVKVYPENLKASTTQKIPENEAK